MAPDTKDGGDIAQNLMVRKSLVIWVFSPAIGFMTHTQLVFSL